MKSAINTYLFLIGFLAYSQPEFRFHGLKIFVDDLAVAESFYTDELGFSLAKKSDSQITLDTKSWPIYLEKSTRNQTSRYPDEARTGLTVYTYKLLPRIDSFRKNDVVLYDSLLSRNGVGISIPFNDPSRNVISLMEVQIREVPTFKEIRLYNTGVTTSDMESSIDFYENILGFEEWSRDYLPDALPLKHDDGSFAFMIHHRDGLTSNTLKHGDSPQMILIMQTPDLDKAGAYLKERDVEFTEEKELLICRTPSGNYIEIIRKQS